MRQIHIANDELIQTLAAVESPHGLTRLSAAAPELLAALKGMVDTPTGEGEDVRAIQAARAAIAKATGHSGKALGGEQPRAEGGE